MHQHSMNIYNYAFLLYQNDSELSSVTSQKLQWVCKISTCLLPENVFL